MSDTRMPRGMLRGCQHRVDNLEKNGRFVILIRAIALAIRTACLVMMVLSTINLRENEDWRY